MSEVVHMNGIDFDELLKAAESELRELDTGDGKRLYLANAIKSARRYFKDVDKLLNTPEIDCFLKGVNAEAAHQRIRWGDDGDDEKGPLDWFWLVGYLAQKATQAELAGKEDKRRHHCISTAAALFNWFRRDTSSWSCHGCGVKCWDHANIDAMGYQQCYDCFEELLRTGKETKSK